MSDDAIGPLKAIKSLLEQAGIRYMVVGSFASMLHGEPRTTHDLDIVIDPSPEQLEALLAGIDPEAFYVDADTARDALRRRALFNVIDMNTAWKIDLIVRKDRAFSRAELARSTVVNLLGVDVPAASAEDTIVSKLEWAKLGGSERQLRDVASIVRLRDDSLDHAYLEQWIVKLDLQAQWQSALAMR